jgi:5-methylcytosine-specific restriction protein A
VGLATSDGNTALIGSLRTWTFGSRPLTERLRGRAAVAQRKRRLQRTNGLCEDCLEAGMIKAAAEVDHITPLALGGSDDDGNTRNLCKPHHEKRTAEQFGRVMRATIGIDGWPK